MLGKFQCRGVLLIWIVVGQGPTVPVIRSSGVYGYFLSWLSFLSLYMADGPIWTEIHVLSQRAVKLKTINRLKSDSQLFR